MYIKRRTGNKPLWIGLALVIFLAFITYKQEQGLIAANFDQKLQTLDLGYSSAPTIKQIFRDLPKIISYKLTDFQNIPPIERIDIDIPLLEYKTILNDRERALSMSTLSNPNDVKAKIRFRGKSFKAKLRLKGDLRDHWLSQYRMSFRVSLKGGNTILDFNKFSLQKPESRQHPFDYTFSDLVKRSGNLASTHNYIRVYVNGSDWGIMNIEEHMSKEYLEKQRRKESLIVRFGDKRKGVINRNIYAIDRYYPYRLSDPRLYLKIYDVDEYISSPLNRKIISYIMEERLKDGYPHLYDIKSYGRALAIAAIWNDAHPLLYSNSRHYFNPYTLKLEPIISDAIQPVPIQTHGYLPRRKLDPFINSYLYSQIIQSEEYRASIDDILNEVISATAFTQNALMNIQKYFPLDSALNISPILESNIGTVSQFKDQYLLQRDTNSKTYLKQNIIEELPASTTHDDHVQIFHRENGRIEIFNLLYAPVKLKELLIDDNEIIPLYLTIPGSIPNLHMPTILKLDLTGDMSGRLKVKTIFRDEENLTAVEPTIETLSYKLPKKPQPSSLHPLPSESQASHFSDHLHARHFKDGRIKIFNLIDDDVLLKNIMFNGKPVLNKPQTIKGYTQWDYSPFTISTNLKGIFDGRITIESEYEKNIRVFNVGPTLDDSDLNNPLINSDENNMPEFIQKSELNSWVVSTGEWTVKNPLLIEGNLHIEAGTTIHFDSDAYLIVKGALIANGTSDKRIIMDSINDSWKGLYVINAKQPSKLTHVEIRDTIALEDGILALSGGTTFYKSEIAMENVLFADSNAEDTLNIVESKFHLNRVKIQNAISDGLDSDFSTGTILSSDFINIGGDALDFSGSNVKSNKIVIGNVGDKAISAGEATTINLEDINIDDVRIGIVSKDGSLIKGKHINIVNYHLGGIMSYMKKKFYPYPSIKLDDVNITQPGNAFSRQHGSSMRINGIDIATTTINVNNLYGK